jgi:tetratricopeptide (TPR) repeat protein
VPIDREKVLQSAQKYVEKKRYDGAIAEYQKIIQEDPNDARTLLKIGDLQARLQAYPEAIATYDRVGQYYATQGFSLKAIAVYKQIREIIKKHAPDLADRYAHIGPRLAEIYTQLGLTSDALAAWDEVATRMQRAGRDREAVDVFRTMVELDRTNPLPHLRLAEACCRVQALDEAIDSFWTAADLLLNLGRHDDALKVVERILHFRADPRFARVAGELYLARGTREDGLQALAKLQVCFQADPKDLDTLGLLGQAFTLIGQADKAIEVYKEMARVARELGRVDVYDGLVDHLRSVAPDDDQVRAFESFLPPNLPPVDSERAQPVDDAELELIDDPESIREEDLDLGAEGSSPDLAVDDDQFEVAEELPASTSFDGRGHARKAIVDAESFRKLRLFPKAVETLHIALEIDPRSLDIRTKLREILTESGDQKGAIAEAVNLAALHIDAGDITQAEPLLRQVLELEPSHEGARALQQQVSPMSGKRSDSLRRRSDKPAEGATYQDYDPNAPLPSYDLEEVSADQALHHERAGAEDPLSSVSTDEPFEAGEDGPLPSFPLHDAESGRMQSLEELDEIYEVEELPTFTDEAAPSDPEALEQALEEAEFFVARGLFEDARAILQEQLIRTPKHRLVHERLREVNEQLGRGGSQTIERSQLGGNSPSGFDVSASLDALDALELGPESLARRGVGASSDVDAEQVFAQFKAGIRAQVSEGDSATHYDLGVAYKEMGLVADAIHELEVAALDSQRECMCHAMIGMIHLEQNALDLAAESYIKALGAQVKTVEQEMNLYYDLGNVYEMKRKKQDALYYFQKIARKDPGYRDVADRLQGLTSDKRIVEPSGTRAVNDDDEFERVFDDLFESKSK